LSALGALPSWIRNVESGSAVEAVFFRMMSLPGGAVSFRRPPNETRPALRELLKTQASNAELYSLRALEDEQQLDFTAAESDWKSYAANSADKIGAQLVLADFYHRRLRPADEIKALSKVANAASGAGDKLLPPSEQRSWRAFDRIFIIIQQQALPEDVSVAQYQAWIDRYPQASSLYGRFLDFLVGHKEYAAATQLIARYHSQFPEDQVFPVKAKAMIEFRQGSVREGLAVYEQSFQPLWDPELVKSYFDLLRQTQMLHKFLDQAQAALRANPEDLNATARVFYYYQQQGKLDAAEQAISEFRLHKEVSQSPWSSQELYICGHLLEDVHLYPEAARYYFALYNRPGAMDSQEKALARLADILLTAPETPIRLGSGDLSLYRDIATIDQGPGYWNGILSLLLNTTQPASEYAQEETRALPYFHRSRAAELVSLLDERFPDSKSRAELHSKLLEFYASAGQPDAVVKHGREFLAAFPQASERISVALLMADAYARKNDTSSEFGIYDSVLQELAAQAQNHPLAAREIGSDGEDLNPDQSSIERFDQPADESSSSVEEQNRNRARRQAFEISSATPSHVSSGFRSPEYARVLERYLARLVELKQVPQAVKVLAREIERNPDDPGLYERLAVFLDQNRLESEQEEVYRRAMAQLSDRSWYDRLARFYLRHHRQSDFEQLTRDVIKSFEGTDLEHYFQNVTGTPALYLRLNQYASQRFPHNPVFNHNLLSAYQNPQTYDLAAWEALLRQHWFEEADLRDRFFEFLSRSGRLDAELNALRQSAPDAASWENNPAAADFLANANLWRSHFEESAPPLASLAAQYPAEREVVRTASSVYRSLAYFDSRATSIAANMEKKLLEADPGDKETLARIGDIYADREQFEQASPYWERIPLISPGLPGGYLEAATIYWDYYDFDSALRLLHQGRERLGTGLYSYEAGAIYENKRDYRKAIQEYVQGAREENDSAAESRLLALAARPKFRQLVDEGTAEAHNPGKESLAAVYLRVKVLEAENRKPELQSFLDAAVQNANSLEQVEAIEALSRDKSLETVSQHALQKQIELTSDPVTRLQLRYRLIQLYEGRKDFQAAETNVQALYAENPKILGVVRSTVDFYWRTKNYSQAISVLLRASQDAYPDLSKQFTYEAARKATEAKQYEQARALLNKLLGEDPYNAEYLAAVADAYAHAGDDSGLEHFYKDKITSLASASMPADLRKLQIASLRRGLIPALTRMRNYRAAVDQYIELINAFPEDDALAAEAALYAARYHAEAQLTSFYAKTVAQSPHDYRWAMVLGRIDTNLEQYQAAIDSYAKAIAIRPDRVDLFIARASLEERLMGFDEAIQDYGRIYQLAYKDPQWMEKIAEARGRQGKTQETVAALRSALIENRPESAANYFEAARRLENWGMLAEARSMAEQGIKIAGSELLANGEFLSGVKGYVRVMTRLRQQGAVYSVLQKALADASSTVTLVEQQVAEVGLKGLTDHEWRARLRQLRMATARQGMALALEEMGNAVDRYFTPEERLEFQAFAESKQRGMDVADTETFAIPWAQSAALADQEARWRFQTLMQRANEHPNGYGQLEALIDLERRRGRFSELGRQLEQFAAVFPPNQMGMRSMPLLAAADAYRSAGDEASELRVLYGLFRMTEGFDPAHQQRLFQLLLAREPEELVRIASSWTVPGLEAANFAVANGGADLSHSVVQARAKGRPPIWNKAYDALVGLYYEESRPEVNRAFLVALGDDTIAERVSKPVDRSEQLAGNTWFYYGSRYGEYLGATKLGSADDYLPAVPEQSPATSSSYLQLAHYYMDSGNLPPAIEEYQYTLELSPNRPDVHGELALAYEKQGNRARALEEWKMALAELAKQLGSPQLPGTFWADFGRTCDQLHSQHLFSEARADVETVIRSYLRRNGNWRSNAVLKPAFLAMDDPAAAVNWMIDLASSAVDSTPVLADIVDASWIPLAQRAPIYEHILAAKQEGQSKLSGLEKDSAQQELGNWEVRWIQYLVRTKQDAAARDSLTTLPKDIRDLEMAALAPLDLELAARDGTLEEKLAGYQTTPQEMPSSDLLRAAARQILADGDKASARKILEFVFAREINDHQLTAANFLGLAEMRLVSGDTEGGVDLLRRLVVVVGNPFENLDPAAALLEKTGHDAEATQFLGQLVRSAPWDSSYRLRLAKAKLAQGGDSAAAQTELASIAAAPETPYDLRIQAAIALRGKSHPGLGSGELDLLAEAANQVAAGAADKFYFYEARIRVAETIVDPQTKMQLLSHCIIDFPRRDEARVPLFRSAVNTRSDEYAWAVIEPTLGREFLTRNSAWISENEELSDGNVTDKEENQALRQPQLDLHVKLSQAEQAKLQQAIGKTLVRLHRFADAIRYFRIARALEPTAAGRKRLSQEIASASAVLRMERQNRERQPLLHAALEQDRVVRPKLMAHSLRPDQTTNGKGASKP